MNLKKFLPGIFLLLSMAVSAQSEKRTSKESEISVSALKFETDNLEELKNFDWSMIQDMFQDNETDEEITLEFIYENKSETDTSKVKVGNFTMKFTGKTSEVDKLIESMKKSFKKLEKITGESNKN
ncbi:hypothetical protein [Gaetbulibacter aestuarii]|uniref:Uncharacterized protein n=1 Tax=Gaetbulibacter aestuarii TaxID=1502358 RepID=A0ABW7N063_9FLAO